MGVHNGLSSRCAGVDSDAECHALIRAQSKEVPGITSGDDIGFRVEGTNPAGYAVGTWVVRLDGRWVPATSQMSVQRP